MSYSENTSKDNNLDELGKEINAMNTPDTATQTGAVASEMESLDAVLEDFNLDDASDGEETVEEVVEEVVEEDEKSEPEKSAEGIAELTEDALRDLDLDIERADAYESQEASEVADEETQAELTANKPRKRGTPRGPRKPRDMNKVDSSFFVLEGDPTTMDQAALDAAKAEVMALKPGQKKVAEKLENLILALSAGRQPSRFTTIAFSAFATNDVVSSADIVAVYKANGVKESTARSQVGQMMNLFPLLKIATRDGSQLTLNKDSRVATLLRAAALPAA